MKCPRCQHENESDAKFCEECAAPLPRVCASCGRLLSATAKFCPECAHPTGLAATPSAVQRFDSPESYTPRHLAERILTSKSALEGERKQAPRSDAPPPSCARARDPGSGAPLQGRACYAAIDMQAAIRRYDDELWRSHGLRAQIRAGLNSGEVVVRAIGSDLKVDYSAVGQTTHLAARMEQLATPGTTLVTAETLRLAEGYVTVTRLGPCRFSDRVEGLRGISTSVLNERLNRLEDGRLIIRRTLPSPAASKVYALTADGEELGRAVVPLAAWGVRFLAANRRKRTEVFVAPGDYFSSAKPLTVRRRATCTTCMSFTWTTR
jgi:class 3 adenylate cyclase